MKSPGSKFPINKITEDRARPRRGTKAWRIATVGGLVLAAAGVLGWRGLVHGPSDPTVFRQRLIAAGLHELQCGGGFLVDPPRAARSLRWHYGRPALVDGAWQTYLAEPRDDEISQRTAQLALGVLYWAGDLSLSDRALARLHQLEAQNAAPSDRPEAENSTARQTRELAVLVAGLNHRWGQACPPGIPPLSWEDETRFFCGP